MLVSGIIVVLVALRCQLTAAQTWGYEAPIGPTNWTDLGYPNCGGTRQSPIDVVTAQATYNVDLTTLDMSSYSTASSNTTETITLTNSGHSVTVSIAYTTTTPKYFIKKGGLAYDYVLDNIHFHWGPDDVHGSEHEMDGHAYPMEAHFVHYRKDLGSVANAKAYSDGLAVLGFFFTISSTDNANLNFLISNLPSLSHKGDSMTLTSSLTPNNLIPATHKTFYRYLGSLTTPGCDEAVIWTVFKDTMTISSSQLALFRQLFENVNGETDVLLTENFRPVQDLHSRTITTSNTATASGDVIRPTFYGILLAGSYVMAMLLTCL